MYLVERGDARRVDSLIAFMSSTEQGLWSEDVRGGKV